MQSIRSAPETQFLRNRNEIAKLAQIQSGVPKYVAYAGMLVESAPSLKT